MSAFAFGRLLARRCARLAVPCCQARNLAYVGRVTTSVQTKPLASSPALPLVRPFATQSLSPDLKAKIDQMVKRSKIVVFMKGDADSPKCGFSNAVVQILRMHGVDKFDTHDVLESDELRQGIKEYSEWPTIPQVFVDGEFVGGCDILLQMHRSGEFIDVLKKVGLTSKLEENAPSS